MRYPTLTALLLGLLLVAASGLAFLSSGVFFSHYAFAAQSRYDQGDPAIYRDRQRLWLSDKTPAMIAKGVANLQANGLLPAIDSYGGDRAALLKAIAIHESMGRLTAVNPSSKAACAFQIIPSNQRAWAAQAGISAADFERRLLTDPAFCTQYGNRALSEAMSNGRSQTEALCRYNGQYRMYRDMQRTQGEAWCWASEEYKVMVAELTGGTFREVNTDKSSPDYNTVTIKDSQGNVIAQTFNCKDHSQELALALSKMADAYKLVVAEAERSTYFREMINYAEGGTTASGGGGANSGLSSVYGVRRHADLKDTECLNTKLEYFNTLRRPLSLSLEQIFTDIVMDFVNQACQYAAQVIAQTLNNVLSSICLPTFSLNFSLGIDLGLPSASASSCNGISLGTLLANNMGMLPPGVAAGGAQFRLSPGHLPAVNGFPSYSWGAPAGNYIMRQRINTNGTIR